MTNWLLIWGAGGHGKVVLEVARSLGRFERILFLDHDIAKRDQPFCGCEVIGGPERLPEFAGVSFVIAVGDNRARARCFNLARQSGLAPTPLVYSTAVIAPSVSIGAGTVVMPGVIINPGTVIGENCIVNSAAVVEHDCRVGAHSHISSRAIVGATVTIQPFAFIGMGAAVLSGATVGQAAIVAAGAVVLASEVPPHTLVAGNPARAVRKVNGQPISALRLLPENISPAAHVRRLVAEHLGLAPQDVALNRWASDYGADSLQLLLLREAFEAELDVQFSDSQWLSFRSFEEMLESCPPRSQTHSTPGPRAEPEPYQGSTVTGDELRVDLEIGIPLTGRNHLAEGPLMQLLGDLRWKHIKSISGVPASRIMDDNGEPIYATFVYTELNFPEHRPMGTLRLDDRFQAECHLRRYGRSVLDGVTYLLPPTDGGDAYLDAPRARLTNVFVRQHNGAEWLKKSRPADPGFDRIAPLEAPPDSLELVRTAAQNGSFSRPPAHYTPMKQQPARIRYKLIPDRDLNAAGLIYFAHYPVFLDIAERETLLSAEAALPENLIDLRTVVRRRSAYLNNAGAHDTLLIEVEPWCGPIEACNTTLLSLWINFRIYRESDGRLMMVSTVEKQIYSKTAADVLSLESFNRGTWIHGT